MQTASRIPALLLLGALGCETSQSSLLDTRDIRPELVATARGDGQVEVTATLMNSRAIASTYVELVDGDALEVQHGGVTKQMQRGVDPR